MFLSDISSFLGTKGEMQRLGSRHLLEYALFHSFGLTLEDVHLAKDSFGKPYFENRPDIHFNLSHSKNQLLCGIDIHPIGVDLEKIRPVTQSLPARFFRREEAAQLEMLPESQRQTTFFEMWTAKESYMKATGRGFSLPLNQIIPDWDKHTISAADNTLPTLYFHHFNKPEGFCVCLCSPKNHFPPKEEMVLVSV